MKIEQLKEKYSAEAIYYVLSERSADFREKFQDESFTFEGVREALLNSTPPLLEESRTRDRYDEGGTYLPGRISVGCTYEGNVFIEEYMRSKTQ